MSYPGIRNPIKVQLVALILAVALPLAAVIGYVWHKAVQESSAAATEVLRLTTARVVNDVRRMHKQVEWMLAQLAAEAEVQALSQDVCTVQATLLRRLHPEFINLFLWDETGRVLCTSIPVPADAALVASTTAAFHRALETRTFQVSDVIVGSVTKKHLVFFAYPIVRAGKAVGVVSTAVALDHFDDVLSRLDLPGGSAVGVLDGNLVFIARTPDAGKWRATKKDFAVHELPPAEARTARLVRGVDGAERLYIAEKVPGTRWKVFAGIPSGRLLSQHRTWLLVAVAMALFMVAASGLGAYLIAARLSRQFNTMLRSEQELMARLMRAEEEERARISRELHDQIGQDLTALAMDLRTLRNQAAPQVVDRAIAMAGRLIEEVRDVSLALRPSQLDDLGLVAALRAHVDRHVRPHGMEVHLNTDADPGRLSSHVEAACFRVAQEALTNVLRHAHAKRVWIDLHAGASEVMLVVRDDGIGFDVDAALAPAGDVRSLGLRNLFDRLRLLGGTVQIKSAPGEGTEVAARFPL